MAKKSYTLNSAHVRRAVAKDLRTIKGWLGHLVSVWTPSVRSSFNPETRRWDFDRPCPAAELPEHDPKDLARTISDIDQAISALSAVREVAERMLVEIMSGRDPLAAPREPTA